MITVNFDKNQFKHKSNCIRKAIQGGLKESILVMANRLLKDKDAVKLDYPLEDF